MKTPTNAFGPRIDWLTLKSGLKPPKLATSLFHHYYKLILSTLNIPEIDTTTRKHNSEEMIFVDDISKISFVLSYSDKKHKPEFSIEFPGEYFTDAQAGYSKAKKVCNTLNKKLEINLIPTRIDIARDIEGTLSNYISQDFEGITFNFNAKISPPFKDARTGEIETLYLMNKGKNRLFTIAFYFKSKEVKKSDTDKNTYYKNLYDGRDFIRVETRLYSEWAKKFTKKFYLENNQSQFVQCCLSNFGYKKRAYLGATESQIKNGNARRAEPWPLWDFYFKPNKNMNFDDKFFVSTEPAAKKAALRRFERYFVMAENDDDFDQLIKVIEKKRKDLEQKRSERKTMLLKQQKFFGELS